MKPSRKYKTEINEKGRVCTACGKFKEWEKFKGHSRSKTGRSSKCKQCYKENRKATGRVKERYSDKARRIELRQTDPTLLKGRDMRSKLMTRHRKLGLDRSYINTGDEFKVWLDSQKPFRCYYTGVEVDLFKCHIDHKQPLNRGGDSRLSNLCITDPKINSAKGQMTEKEFKQLLKLISAWEDGGQYLLMRLRQGFMGKGKFNK